MSDPEHWFDLSSGRVTRRDFIRVGRDLAACLAWAAFPAGSAQRARLAANPFTWGVASGDPLPTSVVLWTRLDPLAVRTTAPVAVRWEIAEDDSFRRIARQGSSAAPAILGHSVHAEIDGLRPGREYWYRFMAGGHASTVGRTRTAALPGTTLDRFRFAFVSCQNYEHGYYTAYRHLTDEDLDLVVHLGDYIYEKHYAANQTVRSHEAEETFTLDQYRARYALYRSDEDLQAAHAAFPWIVTTDDHEVADNYAGPIPQAAVPRAQFLLRRAAAYQAYYEFMPLRRSSMPSRASMRIFRRLAFGNLVDFHVLDTRQYRSDQSCGDGRTVRCDAALRADRTMLGPGQERWLKEGLRASGARWKVLANQVIIAQTRRMQNDQTVFSMDQWDGYVAPRDRLLRFLADARIADVIAITGDAHSNWASDLKLDFDDASSPVVASEFVGTSISSGGDGTDAPAEAVLAANPHIKFYNSRRGYVRATLTPARWTTEFRTVPFVTRPGAPIETRQTFVVEAGHPGVQLQ